MPVFYFHLRDGESGIVDKQGSELPDGPAARAHAVQVARELMRTREVEKRHYRLDVLDKDGGVVAEVPFAAVDPTLDHLRPDLRNLVERMSNTRRELSETLFSSAWLTLELRGMRARSQRKPYLVARNGQRV